MLTVVNFQNLKTGTKSVFSGIVSLMNDGFSDDKSSIQLSYTTHPHYGRYNILLHELFLH
jgi:hypothetical protein